MRPARADYAAWCATGSPEEKDRTMDEQLEFAIRELVIANRILAFEDVVDASGHVSVRHPHDPSRFLISWSRSPELVGLEDIMECSLDGTPGKGEQRPPYRERFIHGAIYEARPEVRAVVHAHSEDVLPFAVTDMPLRPVICSASLIGEHIPVWDIADKFGDATTMLVENIEQGRDLARCLSNNNTALMAGHGMAAAAATLIEVVRISVYAARNARVQMAALRLGKPRYLSSGEINARAAGGYFAPDSHGIYRAWEYWARRAGCAELLPPRKAETLKPF
jgi:ribulose-5-phosphate 4-epimerase/fuculose-1-phosphate aldolase